MSLVSYQTVLDFWFSTEIQPLWFAKNDDFDYRLRNLFGETLRLASQGGCVAWRISLEGRVAEIIVLDQFSRNIYRDTPQAFAQDLAAVCLAQELINQPGFSKLPLQYRRFALMPFMHSESKIIHRDALPLFEKLGIERVLEYELRHKAIIDRFGRYPHRNAILNRPSTDEEIEFLKNPQHRF
ncbi:DUF924 domain-containing protein [Aerococcaceae bacterium NML201209]|nr:DUF924 domain-containing protein [Aerococcaceae bacterium NML201209]